MNDRETTTEIAALGWLSTQVPLSERHTRS